MRYDYSFIVFCIGIALTITGFILGFRVDERFTFIFAIGIFMAIGSGIWDLVKATQQGGKNELQR